MNKAQDIIKKNREGIKKKFKFLFESEEVGEYNLIQCFKGKPTLGRQLEDNLKDFYTSLTQAISEDMEEKMKEIPECPLDNYEHPEYDQAIGFNQALSQVQEYLKKLI